MSLCIIIVISLFSSMPHRDAVAVLAFDRFGNYVTQTLLRLYLEVIGGKRGGDLYPFHRLAVKLRTHIDRLQKVNSGRKIVDLLEQVQQEQQTASATEKSAAPGRR